MCQSFKRKYDCVSPSRKKNEYEYVSHFKNIFLPVILNKEFECLLTFYKRIGSVRIVLDEKSESHSYFQKEF